MVLDPAGPKGMREVQREDLAKGYTYGRTLVPLSEEDANVSRLETFRSFSIMGFIPMEKVRYPSANSHLSNAS
jgi:ATP-dependent DNA helicase 2 subunit 2